MPEDIDTPDHDVSTPGTAVTSSPGSDMNATADSYRNTQRRTGARDTPRGEGGASLSASRLNRTLQMGYLQRKYTPYRTPRTRSMVSPAADRTNTQEVAAQPDWSGLVRCSLNVHHVTPLYRCRLDRAGLKQLSGGLSLHLAQLATAADGNLYRVAVTAKENTDDRIALEITVKRKDTTGRAGSLYAVLCNMEGEVSQLEQGAFTVLPLLLMTGPGTLQNAVVSWLEQRFDCRVCPMSFQPSDLLWAMALGLIRGNNEKVKKQTLDLNYDVPLKEAGLDKISLQIPIKHAQALLSSVAQDTENDLQLDELYLFRQALENHMFDYFRIHLDTMKLSLVATPVLFVDKTGRLKILSVDHVPAVLRMMTSFAFERSPLTVSLKAANESRW
ncbi:centromere protein L-like [Branchiostoma lanceolatum]|uniref:centromere protein L-like n=1 Tax=Branchiostoma lanceolatum TaxID=7740 RepID=UPI003455E8FF